MNRSYLLRGTLVVFLFLGILSTARSQFLIDMIDTTTQEGKGLWSIHSRNDHMSVGGYFQPQFQWAESKGAKSFNGGDFAPQSNNRFMIRRGRIRFEFDHFSDRGLPVAQLVFQFDGTERGVFIRDFWARLFESKWQLFAFTTGMFARPFGYEVNLASSDRESPERGRMSQTLMKTERDLGAMLTFEPRIKTHPLHNLKIDAGIFNGQGLSAPGEYDSYKDFITRVALKPTHLSNGVTLSVGASFLYGGLVQLSKYRYTAEASGNKQIFELDSSESNVNSKSPRIYHGFDGQLKIKNSWGYTELRSEYWWGTQTGTKATSETPGLVSETEPLYVRPFNGAFFYLLQNIFNTKHQLGLKYDWYDPNTHAEKSEIGDPSNFTSTADIKYSTFSFGYNYYVSRNVKLMLWYDIVHNETTSIPAVNHDLEDNILTCRLQLRF